MVELVGVAAAVSGYEIPRRGSFFRCIRRSGSMSASLRVLEGWRCR